MKLVLSASAIALALALAAQGSLLRDLLGDVSIQIDLCPEVLLGASGKDASGRPIMQSSNPACPNYVPPAQASSSTDAPSTSHGYSNSGAPTDAWTVIAPATIAEPDSPLPTSSPAYRLEPLPALLPVPATSAVLAMSEIKQPVSPAPVPALQSPTKCAYVAQAPPPAGTGIEGRPSSSTVGPPVPMVPPVPTQMGVSAPAPARAPAVSTPAYVNSAWYYATPAPLQPQSWGAFPMPAVPDMGFASTIETTQTFYIPEGADGVFFGTRNVGAYQFGA